MRGNCKLRERVERTVFCIRSAPTLRPVPQVRNGAELVARRQMVRLVPGKHRTGSSHIREGGQSLRRVLMLEIPSPWGTCKDFKH